MHPRPQFANFSGIVPFMETSHHSPVARPSLVLSIFLTGFTGVMVYVLVGNIMEFSLLADLLDGADLDMGAISELEERGEHQQQLFLVAGLGTMAAFLVFYVRTLKLAVQVGGDNMKYSPGFGAVCFFIPFVNWYVPYVGLQQAWRALAPEAGANNWALQQGSRLISLWWGLWVCSGLYRIVVMKNNELDGMGIDQLYDQSIYAIISTSLIVTLSICALLMVRSVTLRAQVKWELFRGVPRAQAKVV